MRILKSIKSKSGNWWYYLVNSFLVLLFLAPVYWAFISSIKPRSEVLQYPPSFWPGQPTLQSYFRLFSAGDGIFATYAQNSFLVSIGTVVCVLISSTLAGYALSKLKFRGINFFFMAILAVIMVPYQSLLVPLYTIIQDFGLLDTKISLVLIYTTFRLPIATFIMRNSFSSVPQTLRESALLDGASEWKVLLKVFLPLAWPGLMSVVVLTFMRAWNDFIIALIFTSSANSRTLQVGLLNFARSRFSTDWGMINAGSVATMLPVIILFIFLQRYFIKGMMKGAMK